MNEEEKDIIEFWKDKQAIDIELLMNDLPKFIELIENQKEEIEKKDKIIDLMAEKLNQAYFEEYDFDEWFEEKICPIQQKIDYGYVADVIKQYFERK